jgi:hypothetical protein
MAEKETSHLEGIIANLLTMTRGTDPVKVS